VSERRFLFTNFSVLTSKEFLRVPQSSELLPELGSFVFLLHFELVFTDVFFSQNFAFLIFLNSSVSWKRNVLCLLEQDVFIVSA